MPTVFSHPAVPVAIMTAVGSRNITLRLLLAGGLFSILPDADVIGFYFNIPYDHFFGHRGFFHSPFFALIASLIGALAYRGLGSNYKTTFFVLFVSMLMHGLLDAATNGGLGIALLSPLSNQRYFLPWQPINVSPIGIRQFLSTSGMAAVRSELVWVWAPLISAGLVGFLVRCRIKQKGENKKC